MTNFSLKDKRTRLYIYRVVMASLPILALTGYITESIFPLIAAFLAALLSLSLADVNTRDNDDNHDNEPEEDNDNDSYENDGERNGQKTKNPCKGRKIYRRS